ncbi:ATP-binding protein [Roseomonas populi]|nr:ATP-binding protein [Roseomonas pecuniae]
MSFNRLAFVLTAVVYFALVPDTTRAMWQICIVYAVLAVGLLAHILLRPARNLIRRGFAMVLDVSIISLELWIGGQPTAVLFPLYLWLVLGNGFRFGVNWLFAGMLLSVLQFSAVVAVTPFWREQPHLSAGLLLGLLGIPLYAATLVRKLSAATTQAEEANQAKSMFLASVSHELRTPLTAIIGMGSLLSETRLDNEQRDMVRTVDRASRSLLSLIESILDFSRVEAGRMPPRLSEIDPLTLLGDVRRLLGAQALERGLRLSTHTTLRLPPRILGDAHQLTEVMLNLVGNAIKFTQQGTVTLALDAEPLSASRIRLLCEVSDTGIGIAPEAQERIFDSFVQADPGIFHRFGGTGLGLAICRRLVSLSGGDIGVRSTPGAGSTFWFTLELGFTEAGRPEVPRQEILLLAEPGPLAQRTMAMLERLGHDVEAAPALADAVTSISRQPRTVVVMMQPGEPAATPEAAATALRAAARGRGLTLVLCQGDDQGLPEVALRREFALVVPVDTAEPGWAAALRMTTGDLLPPADAHLPRASAARALSVLVADDSQVNRRVFHAILERAGHRTRLVTNGEEALKALDDQAFDAVLMDVNMPVMDGLEATKLYRFSALGQDRVPIIALTADATPMTRELCSKAGVDAYLTKPVDPRTLIETIEMVVSNRPSSDPAKFAAEAEASTGPQIRSFATEPPLDEATLENLEALGGLQFVAELAHDFLESAEEHLIQLDIAISEQDVSGFRSTVHAIRSGAANLGVRALFDLCCFVENLRLADLSYQGRSYHAQISKEVDRAREALALRLDASSDRPRGTAPG